MNMYFLLNVEVMVYVLVRWIDEDRVSVIPVGWVLQPATIDESDLPTQGVCYWKKRTSKHDSHPRYLRYVYIKLNHSIYIK